MSVSDVAEHIDLERLRRVLLLTWPALYQRDVVILDILRTALLEHDGVNEALAAEPVIMFAWLSPDLGVRAELPRDLLQRGEFRAWRDKAFARMEEAGSKLRPAMADPDSTAGSPTREIAQRVMSQVRDAGTTALETGRTWLRVLVSSAFALIAIVLAVLTTWWSLRNDSHSVPPPTLTGLAPVAGVREDTGVSYVVDARYWETLDAPAQRDFVESVYRALAGDDVQSLVLRFPDGRLAGAAYRARGVVVVTVLSP